MGNQGYLLGLGAKLLYRLFSLTETIRSKVSYLAQVFNNFDTQSNSNIIQMSIKSDTQNDYWLWRPYKSSRGATGQFREGGSGIFAIGRKR